MNKIINAAFVVILTAGAASAKIVDPSQLEAKMKKLEPVAIGYMLMANDAEKKAFEEEIKEFQALLPPTPKISSQSKRSSMN